MASTSTHDHDPALLKAAAIALLVGAGLLLVGNIVHPLDEAMTPTSRLPLATSTSWIVIHLTIAAGMCSVAVGVALLMKSLRAWAGVGLEATVTFAALGGGLLMGALFVGLDGHAIAALAASDAAPATIEAAALAVAFIDAGLAAFGTLLLFGVAFLGASVVLLRSRVLPVATGWLAGVVGVLGAVTGIALAVDGATATTINLMLRPMAMGATITCVALGVSVLRGRSLGAPVVARRSGSPAG